LIALEPNKIIHATILEEPLLLFGRSFPAVDPKLGITLYGPYSSGKKVIRIGIIGDKNTISQVNTILKRLEQPIEGPTTHPLWTQDFPGVSPDSPFRCKLLTSQEWWQTITSKDVNTLDKFSDVKQRISQSVEIFFRYIKNLAEREETPDVIICAPPKRMMDLCVTAEESRLRRASKRKRKSRKQKKGGGFASTQKYLLDYIPELKEEDYYQLAFKRTADNFHHFLKARAMSLGIPTQLILPSTLNAYTLPRRKPKQDDASFAWNLSVALLYKSGGRPWRPGNISVGTCFIGVLFYREREVFGGQMGTSLAQVFTPEGEGLVLRGERFPWPFNRSPHLKRDGAKRLVEKALTLYEQHTRVKPSRVVVHKTSKYTDEELEGFKETLEGIPEYDLLTIATRAKGIRFFRLGYHPIIRGTKIAFPDKTWLLYTKAYIPFLKVYPGPRVPLPLEIIQHIGDSSQEKLSLEILTLTKLNWNSADFCTLLPITLHFARRVGNILRELPPGITPKNKYLYYM
jgi:hypothetical protein